MLPKSGNEHFFNASYPASYIIFYALLFIFLKMPSSTKASMDTSQRVINTPLVIDLCCGMGGISLAAKQLRMKILAGIDVDKAATRTYLNNFPEAMAINGSVRSSSLLRGCKELIEEKKKKNQQTIVVSGPPCQGFSVAGPRDPNDPRNQILLAVARFIVGLKPSCAVIENVARVLDENHSARIRKLTNVLRKEGYHVNQILLNAEDYGVAQRRKRAFFLITRKPITPTKLEHLFELHKKPKVYVAEVIGDLPTPQPRPDRYSDEDDCGSLSNHFAMQHSEKVRNKIAAIPQGEGPMSYRKLHPQRVSNTLISGHRAPPVHYSQPRSITVREAMRLQGFPDDFRVFGAFGNQMTQVTNAVPPPLAKIALQVLCEVSGIALNEHK